VNIEISYGDHDPKVLSQSLTGVDEFRDHPPGGVMGKCKPQKILKTDERAIRLELGCEGKFVAKSSVWDENRVILEGDRLDIEVKHGRWVLTHTPPKPRPPEPARHYFE
jgi:hypothetical protein